MRKVAIVVLLGLGAAATGSALWAEDPTVSPALLSSHTSTFAGAAATTHASPQLGADSDLTATAVTPRQAMSSALAAASTGGPGSHALGSAFQAIDPTGGAQVDPGAYGAHLSSALVPAGASASGDSMDADAAYVPGALQLSGTVNAARTSLTGTVPSDRALTK